MSELPGFDAPEGRSEAIGLSVVIPMHNEEAVLADLVARLRPVLDGLGTEYEVVCIDDGSRDDTAAILLALRNSWEQLRVVRLLRNSGHQAALSAGYDHARGQYVVTIDADLQDPPETIVEMLDVARGQGVDVVYGVRRDRTSDTRFKRSTANLYYRVMRRVAGRQMPHDAGDFRLVSRRVVEVIRRLPPHGRVYRLLIPWLAFPAAEVTFVREARVAGTTKYSLSKMVALTFDSITAFSAAPLRLATWSGLVGGSVGLLAILWSFYGWVTGSGVPGWASTLAVVGFFGSVQLICTGLLGEYVARIFAAQQNRPTYVIGYDSLDEALERSSRA